MSGSTGSLTNAQVKKIRKLAIEGKKFSDIAEQFEVHPTFARSIAYGEAYAHVEGQRAPLRTKKRKPKKRATTTPERNGHIEAPNGMPDLTTRPVDEVLRTLQALSAEWPRIRASFLLLDAILTGSESDD